MSLTLEKIHKKVGWETHLSEIDLEFETGSRNVVLGRTLAGKTSLLRIMAGLDKPTRGRVLVDGVDVSDMPVRKRKVAMVYQQFINYPSLTVYKNIASPLKMSGMKKEEIDRRVRETAELLHLERLLDRLPSELSGGQQQRTAIARALVKDARLLLLDEPLVNLDYKLREELREELQNIFAQREAIVVYTTTEPGEALMIGGNIVVMHEGRVCQTGPTPYVYHNPGTVRVAKVFSDPPINFLDASVSGGFAKVGQDVAIALRGHLEGLSDGDYFFGVRSNHLFLNKNSETDVNIRSTVELAEINGSETFVHVNHGGVKLVVQEDGIHSRKIGEGIDLYVNPESFFAYDKNGNLASSPTKAAG